MASRVFRKSVVLLAVSAVIGLAATATADSLWTPYTHMDSPLPSDFVASIDFDDSGNQYIGTSGGGLALKQGSDWSIWNESNAGVPLNAVRRIVRDGSGDLWVAAASGDLDYSPYGFGVAFMDASDSSWVMRNGGLEISLVVTGIIIDGDIRYVSTYGGGITMYDPDGWTRYRYASRTEYDNETGQQQVYDVDPGTYIPSDYIRQIDEDRTGGVLWMVTADAGAVSYDGQEWTTYNMSNSGLPSNQLLSVKVDPYTGDVCIGTNGFGVAIKCGDDWTVYDNSNSPMTHPFISTIEIRPGDGELWLGTGYGVWVLQTNNVWRGYIPGQDNFIYGNFYSDISFDSTGSVWVSAYGGGMASLFLDSLPPPPPPDSLAIDVQRMFIFFYNNRPVERIFTDIDITGAPELTLDDSVSFLLESDLGELYSFEISFADFSSSDLLLDGWTTHRYKEGRLLVWLRINDTDPSQVELEIKDMDAEMNRENYQNQLTVTIGLGDVTGSQDIYLSGGNEWDVPEIFDPDELGPATVFSLTGIITQTEGDEPELSTDIELGNYPNPFNGRTNLNFNLRETAAVELKVYDLLGRLIDSIHSGSLPAGSYRFAWPDDSGSAPGTGVYIYVLSVDGVSHSKKMTYLK
jgi:hypothetical protein